MAEKFYEGKYSGQEIDDLLTDMETLINFYISNQNKFVYSNDIREIRVVNQEPVLEETGVLYVIKEIEDEQT